MMPVFTHHAHNEDITPPRRHPKARFSLLASASVLVCLALHSYSSIEFKASQLKSCSVNVSADDNEHKVIADIIDLSDDGTRVSSLNERKYERVREEQWEYTVATSEEEEEEEKEDDDGSTNDNLASMYKKIESNDDNTDDDDDNISPQPKDSPFAYDTKTITYDKINQILSSHASIDNEYLPSPACKPHFKLALPNGKWSNATKFKRIYFYHARKAGGSSMSHYFSEVAKKYELEYKAVEWSAMEEPGTWDDETFYVAHVREPVSL